MNYKNILLLFCFFFIVNAYVALTDDDKEEYSSSNKFDELLMTSTLLPKSTVVSTKTIPTNINSTAKTLPTSIIVNEDGVTMKETIYTFFSFPSIFGEATTTIPTDVDEVYASCDYISDGDIYTEPHPPRYYCDNDLNCYTFVNNYNLTSVIIKNINTVNSLTHNCNFFTKRNSDPKPTDTESAYITSICTPAYVTETITDSKRITRTSTRYTDTEQTGLYTEYTPTLYSISKKTYTNINCATQTKSEITNTIIDSPETTTIVGTLEIPTTINLPKTKPDDNLKKYHDEELNDPRIIVVTNNENYGLVETKTGILLPTEVVDYGIYCTETVIGERVNYRPPKTTVSTTTTTTLKTRYCERDDYCFGYYTSVVNLYGFSLNHIFQTCYVYTHKTDEPTRTIACTNCNTSYCRPTQTHYKSRVNDVMVNFVTTVTNGDYVTENNYKVISEYDILKTTVLCKQPPKILPTSTKTITTKIISSETITTPTITTKTITTPSTKCLPIKVTVTEKEKITITERETVTVTVTDDDNDDDINKEEQDDSKCAMKWEQCGGQDYNGPTCCQSGFTCFEVNKYYSQCIEKKKN